VVCPDCGWSGELVAMLTDAEARECHAAFAALPGSLHGPVIRYLSLHRPGTRALSWRRATRLVRELAQWLKAGSLRRKGRSWPVTAATIERAIDEMLARRQAGSLRLPLSGHGYLEEVLVGLADSAEASAEQAGEKARRERPRAPAPVPAAVPAPIDRDSVRRHLGVLKRRIGRSSDPDGPV
jgi:hypothetical protein